MIKEGLPVAFVPCRHFQKDQGSRQTVFVADSGPDTITEGLLVTEKELIAFGLKIYGSIVDPFESCQGFFTMDMVGVSQFSQQTGGNHRSDHRWTGRHSFCRLQPCQQIIGQENPYFIACQYMEFVITVAGANRQPVGIRIIGQNQLSPCQGGLI